MMYLRLLRRADGCVNHAWGDVQRLQEAVALRVHAAAHEGAGVEAQKVPVIARLRDSFELRAVAWRFRGVKTCG
jgi:hypothetical protein